MRYFSALLAVLFGGLALTCAPAHAQGQLVIVGGGLADDNDAVFAAFLDALPAPDAPIAIIPAASGVPVQSATAFAAQLARRGVAPSRIRIIRLAQEDDPASSEDESAWRDKGDDDAEVMRFAGVGGIWFTGGDQARIIKSLLREEGDETAMLSIIRTRFAAGAVIGGTSAGAAIMSRVMIREGDPLSLVPQAGEHREPILLGPGLGFLQSGLVDQHFGERARLIRLVAALRDLNPSGRVGFGIDEDTALVVAPSQNTARVVGRGRVTVVDARSAAYLDGAALDVRRAALLVLGDGDHLDFSELHLPRAVPAADIAAPAPCIAAPDAGGAAISQSQRVAAYDASLPMWQEITCLMAAGHEGLALRFHRAAGSLDSRLMLDIAPFSAQVELKQR